MSRSEDKLFQNYQARIRRIARGARGYGLTGGRQHLSAPLPWTNSPTGLALALPNYQITAGLKFLYIMNNPGETTIPDYSYEGRTLSISGNILINNENLAPYCQFGWSGASYLYRGDEAGLDLGVSTSMAVAVWWKLDAFAGTTQGVISKYTASGNQRSWMLDITSSQVPAFWVSADGVNLVNVASDTVMQTGQWYFLCGRFHYSASLDLWVGSSAGLTKYTNTVGIPAALKDSSAQLQIGATDAGSYGATARGSFVLGCGGLAEDYVVENWFNSSRGLFGV